MGDFNLHSSVGCLLVGFRVLRYWLLLSLNDTTEINFYVKFDSTNNIEINHTMSSDTKTLLFSYINIGLFQISKEERSKYLKEDILRLENGDKLETIIKDRQNTTIAKSIKDTKPVKYKKINWNVCRCELTTIYDCEYCSHKLCVLNESFL